MNQKNSSTKSNPKGYLIPLLIPIVGYTADTFGGINPEMLRFPVNVILLAVVLLLTGVFAALAKKKKRFKYFYSLRGTVGAIVLFGFVALVLALVPEKQLARVGFDNFRFSFVFVLSYAYLILVLGLAIIKRIMIRNLTDLAFFLNHYGLWLVLVSMALNAADSRNMMMSIGEGQTVWYGVDAEGRQVEPGFAIELEEFEVDFFPPKFAIVDPKEKAAVKENRKPLIFNLEKGKPKSYIDYTLTLLELGEASEFAPGNEKMKSLLPTYATIKVEFPNGKVDTARITAGNFMVGQEVALLASGRQLRMMSEEAKLYRSAVKYYSKDGYFMRDTIEVNKPGRLEDYKVYQTDYSPSPTGYRSTLTLIKEPWIIVGYVGMIMLIAGSLYLIFERRNKKEVN